MDVTATVGTVEMITSRCPACQQLVHESSIFCPLCGNEMAQPEEVSVNEIIGNLEEFMAPWSRTVFLGKDEKGRTRRAEYPADELGHLSLLDRQALHQLLSELVYFDSFLSSDVLANDQPARCVWHVISGGVFSLSAVHAEFILFFHDSLLPMGFKETSLFNFVDAPTLWSLD